MNRYEDYTPKISDPSPNDIRPTDPLTYSDTSLEDKENTEQTKRNKKPTKSKNGRKTAKNASNKAVSSKNTPTIGERWQVVKDFFNSVQMRFLIGTACILFAAYLLVAFISYLHVGWIDQSNIENLPQGAAVVKNMGGEGGARLSQMLINNTFGVGSIVIILWLIWIALKQYGIIRFKIVNFTIKCIVALVTISLIVGLMTIAVDSHFHWGGNHGHYINQIIINYIGWAGAALLCILMLAVFFMICLNDIVQYFLRKRRERKAQLEAEREAIRAEEERIRRIEQMENPDEEYTENVDEIDPDGMIFHGGETPEDTNDSIYYNDNTESDKHDNTDRESDINDSITSDDDIDNDNSLEDDGIGNTPMTVNVNEIGRGVADDDSPEIFDPTAILKDYKFPSYNLLREEDSHTSIDEQEQLENEERIRSTLLDFDIAITNISATVGPTVTLYEVRLEKGIKIARIRNLGDDIALSLAAKGVRIIAPIPGKGTVGIEVANKDPQTVSMRTIVTSCKYQDCKYELPIAIGSTINNQVYIADLAKMPHLLVAGATGQGKSVGLNAIIASLLYRKHPSELKFVLIDPKMVEFSLYKELEHHYLAKIPGEEEPIITSPDKVVATLSSLCVLMDDRYSLLKMAHVRNIKEYNYKFTHGELKKEDGHNFMPYIVVIVDEFSDLIMTAGKEVEIPIARLAQKARAIGIHVIIATQRPSTNVITGVIKANFPARVAFKVASGVDSKTILDTPGAEHLIGRGDMLISTSSEMERVQCAFIDTPEVTAICEFIGSQQGFLEPYKLPEPIINGADHDGSGVDSNSFGERDPLFDEIARFVVNGNTASTSSLQRRYSIGYNRAGKIMDQLEAAGIVGPSQGGKPRNVLVDPMTLESILSGGI